MRAKCKKIIDHGIGCFVNRQLIYNFPEQIFTDAGVISIEHADFDGIERLAAVTGGEIASTFDRPDLVALGECKLIDEIMIGEDRLIRFSGCKSGAACSIILRGASSHLLDEAERSLHDALCVLTETVKETRVICGGGCLEMLMANAIDKQVPTTAGKAALAMESFARALRQLPTIIADNAGYDSSELVTQLRAAHAAGNKTAGLDMNKGTSTSSCAYLLHIFCVSFPAVLPPTGIRPHFRPFPHTHIFNIERPPRPPTHGRLHRRHVGTGYPRVVQVQAASAHLCGRGGRDDSPRRRHHQGGGYFGLYHAVPALPAIPTCIPPSLPCLACRIRQYPNPNPNPNPNPCLACRVRQSARAPCLYILLFSSQLFLLFCMLFSNVSLSDYICP